MIFLAVSEFLKKIRIDRAGNFFSSQKNLGFFFSREKKTGLEHAYSSGHVQVMGFWTDRRKKRERDYTFTLSRTRINRPITNEMAAIPRLMTAISANLL